MKKRNLFPLFFYIALLAFVFWLIFAIFGGRGNDIAYSEVVKLLQKKLMEYILLKQNMIILWLELMELHLVFIELVIILVFLLLRLQAKIVCIYMEAI